VTSPATTSRCSLGSRKQSPRSGTASHFSANRRAAPSSSSTSRLQPAAGRSRPRSRTVHAQRRGLARSRSGRRVSPPRHRGARAPTRAGFGFGSANAKSATCCSSIRLDPDRGGGKQKPLRLAGAPTPTAKPQLRFATDGDCCYRHCWIKPSRALSAADSRRRLKIGG
jgi:hypothetical protein